MVMRLHPLGYPVDIVSNSEAVLAAASKSWGSWPALFDTPFEKPPMRFEIEIHHSPGPRNAPTFEAPAGWLTFSADEDNFAAFELESRIGYMSVGDSALRDDA